jgi:hypothetical protein
MSTKEREKRGRDGPPPHQTEKEAAGERERGGTHPLAPRSFSFTQRFTVTSSTPSSTPRSCSAVFSPMYVNRPSPEMSKRRKARSAAAGSTPDVLDAAHGGNAAAAAAWMK